jgi:hypothetical protein
MYVYYFVLNKSNALHNPASFVTNVFGVRLSRLPGILIFSKDDNQNRTGLFFPVHVDLFKDTKRLEARLTQLFDMIGDVRAKGMTSDAIIADLARSLRRWKANEQLRPFWDYAARQSARLVNLPSDIVKKIAEGFARGLVSQGN